MAFGFCCAACSASPGHAGRHLPEPKEGEYNHNHDYHSHQIDHTIHCSVSTLSVSFAKASDRVDGGAFCNVISLRRCGCRRVNQARFGCDVSCRNRELQDASALAPHERVDEECSPIWKGKRVVVLERVLGIELAK
jgi:hypothetical protein